AGSRAFGWPLWQVMRIALPFARPSPWTRLGAGGVSLRALACTPCSSPPRIDDAGEDVRQQIHADIDQADDDGSAQDRIHIGGEERRGDVAADARPGKHGL